jgi:CubicO group peptidase (beta-lactamase class C family)
MSHHFYSISAVVCLSVVAAFGQNVPMREAEVKRLAQPLVDSRIVPGLVVGIYNSGHTETFGLGVIGKQRSTAPDANTIYEIGSVSKVFTSLLLADAITRGEVSLGTPLSKFLPAKIKAPKHGGQEITLEDLATHFSGLPRIPENMAATNLVDPYAHYDRDKLFAFLNGYEVPHEPGKEWAYSNLGMGLLGTLLADEAGKSYDELLHERVAKPLAMTDTVVHLSVDQQSRLAPPHRGGVLVSNWNFQALAGCGAVRSTVNDLLKLVAATVDPASTSLKASIQLATQKRREIPPGPKSMALGWMIAGDRSTLWHNGQTGGYSASVFVSPALKKGVVVLANGADSAIDVLGERLFQSLAGMKVEPPKVRPSVLLTDAQLNRLVGEYPSSFFTISITRQEDSMFAQLTGQQALVIRPETPTNFFYSDVEADLKFEIDPKTDRAKSVTLLQNGKEIYCPRR